jgi:PQ loop repeat
VRAPLFRRECAVFGREFTIELDLQTFWFWDDFNSYTKFLVGFILTMMVLTLACRGSLTYVWLIGLLSSGIEALLGVPQFLLNYRRKNTSGVA